MSELEALAERVRACFDCPLSATRVRAVPGEGPERPDLMFIGEGPGFHEDQQGRPFVGPAGKYLEHLLASIGLRREQVFITNVVKCRPPGNRDPLPGEIEACRKHLDQQIELLQPKAIVTLGRFSMARYFPRETISRIHGRPRVINGQTVIPMYHPAAALHQGSMRQYIEEDFSRLPELAEQAVAEPEEAPAQPPQPQQPRLFA